MLNKEFEQAKPVLERIEKHGYEAYFVGGCVRDLLLKRPIKDIDMTTSARPKEIQEIFPSVIPVGIEHGTVIVRHEDTSYEVTTFRTEGTYSDGRHPDHVEFIRSIEKDLERRDFTINALAMDIDGNIIDLFGGRNDLDNRIIRTVGEGKDRFGEDALRIIRALRFSSQLGFQIGPETYEAMVSCREAILRISVERITKEMEQFFAGNFVSNGMDYLKQAQIETVLPIFKDHPQLIHKLPRKMKSLQTFAEVVAYFHYLFPEIPIKDWTKEWKCSNRTKKTAMKLVSDLAHYRDRKLDRIGMYRLKREHFAQFIRLVDLLWNEPLCLSELEQCKESLPIQSRDELKINGNDILALFPEKKSGPWIKELLDTLERKIIVGELTNREEEIREWLMWKQTEIN